MASRWCSSSRQNHQWYVRLSSEGKRTGYLVNGIKSWLIVKTDYLAKIGDSVNITGKRHLGEVIGSENYKTEYCNEIV